MDVKSLVQKERVKSGRMRMAWPTRMATMSSRQDQMAAVTPLPSCGVGVSGVCWLGAEGVGAYDEDKHDAHDGGEHDEEAGKEQDDEADLAEDGGAHGEDDGGGDGHDAEVGDEVHDEGGHHVEKGLGFAKVCSGVSVQQARRERGGVPPWSGKMIHILW